MSKIVRLIHMFVLEDKSKSQKLSEPKRLMLRRGQVGQTCPNKPKKLSPVTQWDVGKSDTERVRLLSVTSINFSSMAYGWSEKDCFCGSVGDLCSQFLMPGAQVLPQTETEKKKYQLQKDFLLNFPH